jgi:hypothetical protein
MMIIATYRIDENDCLRSENQPYRVPNSNSTFDHETNAWVATNMPKAFPDKREDVRYLEKWLTER